ncbi:MAG: hypothetical protein LBB86_04335 [Oscillospiraceae bacterium]|jgi:hypothetical protein|nr:hypothetical protein [Oscillospiraceae bacterium]
MACFLVPATEAVVTTIVKKAASSKPNESGAAEADSAEQSAKISFVRKLKWLNNMLWGGSALLAFEHVWHGEVTPWFPFLTAASDPADTAEMLHEMATAGVSMAVIVTVVWLGMVLVASAMERKERKAQLAVN